MTRRIHTAWLKLRWRLFGPTTTVIRSLIGTDGRNTLDEGYTLVFLQCDVCGVKQRAALHPKNLHKPAQCEGCDNMSARLIDITILPT